MKIYTEKDVKGLKSEGEITLLIEGERNEYKEALKQLNDEFDPIATESRNKTLEFEKARQLYNGLRAVYDAKVDVIEREHDHNYNILYGYRRNLCQ